jgi:hypothetical protein
VNGSAAGGVMVLAKLEQHLPLSHDDFYVI